MALIISVGSIVAVGIYSLFWLRSYNRFQIIGEKTLNVPTEAKVIALTFDDGPNPPFTTQILDILSRYDARATFFVVGRNAATYPDVVRETIRRGHEVGNHSWDHSRLVFRPLRSIRKQIEATDKVLRGLGYQGTIYFRAPYGIKLFVLPYILWKSGRHHILYDIVVGDWTDRAPERMLDVIDEQLTNGSIVLLHDGDGARSGDRRNTVELVRLILEKYTPAGYRFLTISELLSHRVKSGVRT